MNGDGINDIVSGSWPGEIYVMQGRKDGTFAAGETIKGGDGEAINLDNASTVAVVDWDRDGDLDLVVSGFVGEVNFIANEGGVFAKPMIMQAAGQAIHTSHGGPAVADWDGNGTLDLLVGEDNGQVQLFSNQTSKGLPELGEPVVLIPPSANTGDVPGLRAKIDVTDWNGDGKLDLLLGDYSASNDPNQPVLELSEADSKTRAAAQVAIKPIEDRLSALFGKIQQEGLKKVGVSHFKELTTRAMHDEFGAYLGKEMKARGVYDLQAELAPYRKVLDSFVQPFAGSGKVWVFLRK